MKPQLNKEIEALGTSSKQEEALKAIEALPDSDKVKVLDYIQSLINYAKNEDN